MSLTSSAPAFMASLMTTAELVSTEIQTSKLLRIASISGITRANSSSTDTSTAPGRVDSPPISIIRAPSSMSVLTRPSTLSTSITKWLSFADANSEPSEKESGVALIIPMQTGEDRSICLSPAKRENVTKNLRLLQN